MQSRFKFIIKSLILVVPFVLISCGFKPMYGQGDATSAGLAQLMANIKIDPITNVNGRRERLAQTLFNNLSDRISPLSSSANAAYILKTNYQLEERGYGIRADESVTLQNLKLSVAFRLVDIKSDEAIMEGTARAIVTFDLVQSDFSNKVAHDTSLDRLSVEAANQVVTRIGTYFSNHPELGEASP